jgi:hypothetical protein
MALEPAPHPPPVFRVLKQAWREYLGRGNAIVLTISTPPNQAATAPTTVTGTVTADPSVTRPISVTVQLIEGGNSKAAQTVGANLLTGAYTATFPANTLTAGSATATAAANYATAVTSSAFTVT